MKKQSNYRMTQSDIASEVATAAALVIICGVMAVGFICLAVWLF